MAEARWSLEYHQCKNWRKKIPVDSDVDRITADQLSSLLTITNIRRAQLQNIDRFTCTDNSHRVSAGANIHVALKKVNQQVFVIISSNTDRFLKILSLTYSVINLQ